MPASPSAKAPTSLWVALVVAAILVVAILVLPASWVARALPSEVRADDFSGSLWHGSAGRVSVSGRDAGAVEWHLHPASLLRLRLAADVRWVKIGFVAQGRVEATSNGVTLSDAQGSGPLVDLQDLGLAQGWRGDLRFSFKELTLAFAGNAVIPQAAVGTVDAAGLSSAQFAGGADIGSYQLKLANGAITPDTDATGELVDTGGPLELRAVIHYTAGTRTAMLSGTLKERTALPPAFKRQIDTLAELHARDSQGRIPIDLEFTP